MTIDSPIVTGSLTVIDAIKGIGSIYLQPDTNDGRQLQIYNTAAAGDVHIKGNSGFTFLGDDTNYVKIDDYLQTISITGANGVAVSSSLTISGSLTATSSINTPVVNSPRLQNGSQYIVQDTNTQITAIQNGSQTWGFYPGGQFYPAGVIGGSSYGSNQLNVTNLGPVQLKGTLYGAQIVTSPDQETTYSYAWNFKTDGDLELPTGKSITGSLLGTASYALTASSADAFTVRNTLTAQTLVVQIITSSVDFVTGSTRFGSLLTNTHVFSGSVTMNPNGLFVSSSGNVGIGTTTPKSYFHLAGENSFNIPLGDILLTRYYTNDSLVAGSSLFHFYNNTDSKEYLAVGVAGSGGTANKPNQLSQIKMVVGASGNVGIGTASPTNALHISGSGANTQTLVLESSLSSANAYVVVKSASKTYFSGLSTDLSNSFIIYDGTANTARILITTSGSILAGNSTEYRTDLSNIRFSIFNSSSNPTLCVTNTTNGVGQLASIHFGQMINNGTDARPGGSIKSIAVGTYTGGVGTTYSADLAFYTSYQNSDTERMRITSGGYVYINATSNPLPDNAQPQLGITGGSGTDAVNIKHTQNANNTLNIWQTGTTSHNAIAFYKGDTQTNRGLITVTTSGTTYNSVSDYRLKENIVPLENGLDRVLQLKPSKFNWIETGNETEGFIAHELQEYFPDAVTGEKDAVYSSTGNIKAQSVDYGRITPLLVKAIQELKAEFDEYKATHP